MAITFAAIKAKVSYEALNSMNEVNTINLILDQPPDTSKSEIRHTKVDIAPQRGNELSKQFNDVLSYNGTCQQIRDLAW